MKVLDLTAWQRRRLKHQLAHTQSIHLYRRTLALLEVDQGRSISEVARMLGVTRQSIYNWIDAYCRVCDHTALADETRPGRPPLCDDDTRSLLREMVASEPEQFGYLAANWTVPLLQEQLEHHSGRRVSDDTIRRELQRMGYVWKRTRYVLEPDPEREKKTLDPGSNQVLAAQERASG